MRRSRHVKIIATIGPASATKEVIERLFHCGVDVFRINMSHATPADLTERVAMIREIEAENGRPIAILVDLQGPKLRIGTFTQEVHLEPDDSFVFDDDPAPGDKTRV